MSRKREPFAVIGDEDYLIVRHTHDVNVARRLMAAALIEEADYCPARSDWLSGQPHTCTDACVDAAMKTWADRLAKARQVYVRIQGALPNSFAAAEGWSYAYHEYDKPGRGAFPAVVFR